MQTSPDSMARAVPFALDGLVGQSESMAEMRRRVEQAAISPGDVLLQGEPGTGKELVAHLLHELGGRRGPFIKIDGRAPSGVLDDKLFGPKGKDSTVYLFNVTDVPARTQAQLVQALEERERADHHQGAASPFSEVRLVVGASRDVLAASRAGKFLEPLLHRFSDNRIELPPLRSRREDIPLLLDHFLIELRRELGHEVERFAPESVEILARRYWAGNVDELFEYVRTTVVLVKAKVIEPVDLWLPRSVEEIGAEQWNLGYRELRRRVLLRFEADFVSRILKAAGGNVSMAARLAKIDRKHLWRLIQRTGIRLERLEKSS
jgi:two-component system response regulator GlrR